MQEISYTLPLVQTYRFGPIVVDIALGGVSGCIFGFMAVNFLAFNKLMALIFSVLAVIAFAFALRAALRLLISFEI